MARGLLVQTLALAACVSAANICGTRGTHDDSKLSSYMGNYFYRTQSTFTLCASWCKKDTKCQSFRYSYWSDAAAQYCEYFDAGLDGNMTADSTQPYYYYDVGCAFPPYADGTATTTVVARVAATTTTVTASADDSGDTSPKTLTQTVTTTSTQQAITQTVTTILFAPASTQTITQTATQTQTQFRTTTSSVFVAQPTTVTRSVGVPVTVTPAARTITSTRVVTTTVVISQTSTIASTRTSTVTVTTSVSVTLSRPLGVADVPQRTVTTTTTGTVIRMAPRVVTTTVTRGWKG